MRSILFLIPFFSLIFPLVSWAQSEPMTPRCFEEEIALSHGGGVVEIASTWQEHCPSISDSRSTSKYFSFSIPGPDLAEVRFTLYGNARARLYLRKRDENRSITVLATSPRIDPYSGQNFTTIRRPLTPGTYTLEAAALKRLISGPNNAFALSAEIVPDTGARDFALPLFSTVPEIDSSSQETGSPCIEDIVVLKDGVLSEQCFSITEEGKFAAYYVVKWDGEYPLQVLLESDSVDTLLKVFRLESIRNMQFVKESDDRNDSSTNSSVVVHNPGRYLIEATTSDENTAGDFTLTLSPLCCDSSTTDGYDNQLSSFDERLLFVANEELEEFAKGTEYRLLKERSSLSVPRTTVALAVGANVGTNTGITAAVMVPIGAALGSVIAPPVGAPAGAAMAGIMSSIAGGIIAGIDSFIFGDGLDGKVNDHYRILFHYVLKKKVNGEITEIEGSCLYFYTKDYGRYGDLADIEIDNCSHDNIFPEEEDGIMRVGDWADPIERHISGQHKVVISKSVP